MKYLTTMTKNMMKAFLFLFLSLSVSSFTQNVQTNNEAPVILTPGYQYVNADERLLCYDIAATIPYEISNDAEWISIRKGKGQTVYAHIQQNQSDRERTAHITFHNEEKEVANQLVIYQEADASAYKEAKLLTFNIGQSIGSISANTVNIEIPADDINQKEVFPFVEVSKGASYLPSGLINLNQSNYFTVLSGDGQNRQTYKIQINKTYKHKQFIDANRVFFSGRLKNHQLKGQAGDANNQNKFFDYTYGWDNLSDTLVWGIDTPKTGSLSVTPVLGVASLQKGSVIELSLDDQKETITLNSANGLTSFTEQGTVRFTIKKVGRHTLKMAIKSIKSEGEELAYAKGIYVSGNAAEALTPVALRWRPSAIHCRWQNSKSPEKKEIAVHEVTIKSHFIDSYSPIITPFGYYGSTWDAATQQFGGLNFSLWSFGKGATPPSTEKFSHLIAAGKGLHIDGFNHEGTGVKCRGANPFASMAGQRTQVLAVMKVPGNPYDVYYSYYWDTNQKEWNLMGCGKKYNTEALSYISTGAFVEVPGPAHSQRSNHIKREVEFRGWYIDSNRNIFPIDKMLTQGTVNENSYKNWSKTDDGKFVMSIGGFEKPTDPKPYAVYQTSQQAIPEYLNAEHLKSFGKLPVTITTEAPSLVTSHSAELRFNVDHFGTLPTVKLYWGTTDGLTFVEGNKGNGGVVKWQQVTTLSPQKETFTHKLENLSPNTKYYYRLQICNEEGEIWSWDTNSFTTLP